MSSPQNYIVDVDKLTWTSVAASIVILGIVSKNSIAQAGWGDNVSKWVGGPIYIVGWILVAIALTLGKQGKTAEQAGAWICSITIAVTAVISSVYMSKGRAPPLAYPILFGLAWLALGWVSGTHILGRVAGLMGAVLVVASMVFLLPLQRAYGVVDGPGMALIVLGWVLVVFGHSVIGWHEQ